MSEETVISIQWFDSACFPALDVYSAADMQSEKPVVLITVGWLVGETAEPYGGSYTVAASKHREDWRGLQIIPKANVISTQYLWAGSNP